MRLADTELHVSPTHATSIRLPFVSDALIVPVIGGSCLSSSITMSGVRTIVSTVISMISYYRGTSCAEYEAIVRVKRIKLVI